MSLLEHTLLALPTALAAPDGAAHAHASHPGPDHAAGTHEPTPPRVLHVPAGAGEMIWVVGDTYTFKATGAETDGQLFVWEASVPPLGGPPPHIHHTQQEAYYLLEGELEIMDGERTFAASAGSFVYIPPGVVHSFRNTASTPARMLVWMTPAGFENFFREVGQRPRPGESAPLLGPEEMAKTIDAAPRYGMEVRLSGSAPLPQR